MRSFKFFMFISVVLILFLAGCGPTQVIIRPQHPSGNYPEKFDAKIALNFDEEITTYIERLHTTGDFCAGNSYDVPVYSGITDAVTSALRAIFSDVSIVDKIPDSTESKKYDAIITVKLSDFDDDVEITALTYGRKAKATFQVSLNLEMFDNNMNSIFSYTPHATGIKSDRITSCKQIGEIIGFAFEKTIAQISTDIAQSFYNSRQVADFMDGLHQ